MLRTIFLAIFSALCSTSLLANTEIKASFVISAYRWCNGPVRDPRVPSNCYVLGWPGVDLDSLVNIAISSDEAQKFIQLTDNQGNAWSKDVRTCVSGPLGNDPGSCSYRAEQLADGTLDVIYTELDEFGRSPSQLHFQFQGSRLKLIVDHYVSNLFMIFDIDPVTPNQWKSQ